MANIINAAGSQNVDSFVSALLAALPPIYNTQDKNTLHALIYKALAEELVKADITLESIANQNYLSVPVTDELTIRGSSSRDRLQNENAFELDGVRLNPSSQPVLENISLQVGENKIQLQSVPNNIDFIIFNINGSLASPTNFPTSFDTTTNTLTITANKAGAYVVAYQDTGNVLKTIENIFVPEGLFRLGFGEGPFNELGWGE